MSQPGLYDDHNYYSLREHEEETGLGEEQEAMASTSAAAVAVGGHDSSGGAEGPVSDVNVEGHPDPENESDETDDNEEEGEEDEASTGEEISDGDLEEPIPLVAASASASRRYPRHSLRRSRRRRRIPFQFTQWQVEEMESLFEETQYPDVLTRGELARALNVPEVKVKVWFINRRAKQRKNERREMLRNMPPGVEDFIFMTEVEEPSCGTS